MKPPSPNGTVVFEEREITFKNCFPNPKSPVNSVDQNKRMRFNGINMSSFDTFGDDIYVYKNVYLDILDACIHIDVHA